MLLLHGYARKADSRNGLQSRRRTVGHQPLQLFASPIQVTSALKGVRGNQDRPGGIARTRVIAAQRGTGGLDAHHSVVARLAGGGFQRLEIAHGLAGLVVLIPLPSTPAGKSGGHNEYQHHGEGSVTVPPRFDSVDFFLFFEIVCHNLQILDFKSVESRSKGIDSCWAPDASASWRNHLTVALPEASSSSPSTTAAIAPLASARRNCDLKPVEPA